jgi:hypothetical protein
MSYKNHTVFISTGNPATVNDAEPYHPGQLGQRWEDRNNGDAEWEYVKLDSGATAATPVGVTAAGQLAFWKDRAKKIVTNDLRFAPEGRNGYAGVIGGAVTAGHHCWIQRGGLQSVVAAAGTYAAGDLVVPNSGTAAAGTVVAAGTAPTHRIVGVAQGARDAGTGKVAVRLETYED